MRPQAALAAFVALLLTVGAAPAAAGMANPSATLVQLAQDVGGRGAAANPARFAYLEKLDSHVQAVAVARLGDGTVARARIAADRQGITVSPAGDVLVDVYASRYVMGTADELRALGMRVTAVSNRAPQRLVEGYLPAAGLPEAAALSSTRAILASLAQVSIGSFTSQGDGAIDGPAARIPLGPAGAGAGVSVGIISDSIDQVTPFIAGSVGSLDLPPNTVALSDFPGGTDEGRAMAEIVYDEAPNLSGIYFETANGGAAAKAHAIDDLVAHGVKVIADDTTYLTEPFFQDDLVAQAIDRAKAAGVAYFASAGNDSRNAWEGTFTPAPASTMEDFDPGPAVDTMQSVQTIPADTEVDIVLQWAEPWGHATTNLDLDVYDITGGGQTLVGSSTSNNALTGVPLEFVGAQTGSIPATLGVVIRRTSGSATPFMKYVAFINGPVLTMEHPSPSAGSIGPDAASANGALAVAASQWDTPTTPEDFSSRGPVTHFFDANGNPFATPDVRQKPNLAAPDGVSTSLSDFRPFFGTSAAAPAAAGIAALIRSAKPGMAIDELYAIMTTPANAQDCALSAAAPDPDCGAGFLMADRAMSMALDGTPPVITPALSPAAPDGANGWYRDPVSVTWNLADPESPIVDASGCGPASVVDSTAPLTCSAASAGGTTSVPLTIKVDSTPPSAPAITGIGAKTYLPATLPTSAAVQCTATDPTSGAGCAVTGYGTGFGAHTLIATATNDAGLTTTATLTFTVAKPVAIAKLKLTKLKLAKLRSSGLTLTVGVAAASTRLVVKVVATVPKASGHGTRTITIGRLTKKNVAAGAHTLRVTLTRAGKLALSTLQRATLKVTISANSPGANAASLKGSLVVKR